MPCSFEERILTKDNNLISYKKDDIKKRRALRLMLINKKGADISALSIINICIETLWFSHKKF